MGEAVGIVSISQFWQIYKYFRFYASLPAAIWDLTLYRVRTLSAVAPFTAENMGVAVGISSLSSIVLSLDIRAISCSPK